MEMDVNETSLCIFKHKQRHRKQMDKEQRYASSSD